jgi:hypothetical protein
MSLTSIDTMSWSAMIRFRAGGRSRVEDPSGVISIADIFAADDPQIVANCYRA